MANAQGASQRMRPQIDGLITGLWAPGHSRGSARQVHFRGNGGLAHCRACAGMPLCSSGEHGGGGRQGGPRAAAPARGGPCECGRPAAGAAALPPAQARGKKRESAAAARGAQPPHAARAGKGVACARGRVRGGGGGTMRGYAPKKSVAKGKERGALRQDEAQKPLQRRTVRFARGERVRAAMPGACWRPRHVPPWDVSRWLLWRGRVKKGRSLAWRAGVVVQGPPRAGLRARAAACKRVKRAKTAPGRRPRRGEGGRRARALQGRRSGRGRAESARRPRPPRRARAARRGLWGQGSA
ncbi:MAG: hypothetical protein J3K34DRAFT_118325 [Monoraphidium minutum]|nr:MAG: hypothetical protein J3K34DRAFT_118325 [Monoraphidium minutum]